MQKTNRNLIYLTTDKEKKRNEHLYRKLLLGRLGSPIRRKSKLSKYAHVFRDEDSNDFKGTDVIEHQIVLEDTRPIRKTQYRVPYALRGEMKTQVKKCWIKT